MKLALASLLLAACDAQVDGGYPGEALVRVHGTAVGFRSDEFADGAAVRWNTQVGADLRAGPIDALPLEASPPSGLSVVVLAPPPEEAYFAFTGEPARIAEGTLFLSNAGELVGQAIGFALIHVDGPMAPGSLSAGYVGGTPAPGFHLCDVRPTAELSDAQAYFAARCGDDPQCRYRRLYKLVTNSRDLGAELQFFRGTP
jgi:hypothetical protein